MEDDPYVHAGTRVLRNRLGIRDRAEFERVERQLVWSRSQQAIPAGDFDLRHLKAIHHHLFQDLFDWAGEIRTVEIVKGDSQFQFRQYIETGMSDVHRRLVSAGFMAGLTGSEFAAGVAPIIGDVNYVHPFREGNGRTQLHYLKQLCDRAGHRLDLTKISASGWIEASIAAHRADYRRMNEVIASALQQS